MAVNSWVARFASGAALLLAACGHSPGYLAACHGEPLRTPEAREQAMVEGYEVRPGYDCIDKASYAMVQAQQARWAAENTPEAKARREAEQAAAHARAVAEDARAAAAREQAAAEAYRSASPAPVVLRPVDANSATEQALASVITLDATVAAQIVAARRERPFRDWDDLVARVVGLSAAQPAVYASICGLTVNGESLAGAPPDASMATRLREKYRQY